MPRTLNIQLAMKNGATSDDIHQILQENPDIQADFTGMKQDNILEKPGPVTENFGQYQPQNEVFSKGVTNGTGFGVPEGTKVALPPGKWQVADSYNQASGRGYIGNGENQGYGNSAFLRNTDTGEWLRYSHLSANFVKPGQTLDGNTVIGATGATGNVTGPHLNLEYYDKNGQLGDVTQSSYGKYLGQ